MKIQQTTKTQNTNKNKNKQFKCNNVYFIASLLSEMPKFKNVLVVLDFAIIVDIIINVCIIKITCKSYILFPAVFYSGFEGIILKSDAIHYK